MTDEVKKPEPTIPLEELDSLLTQWTQAQQNAEAWKDIEMSLRKRIFAGMFPMPERGANKLRINHGMALIGTYSTSFTIDRAGLAAATDDNTRPLIEAVVAWAPSIRDAKYQELKPEDKMVFHDFVTEKASSPKLELKPASKVRW